VDELVEPDLAETDLAETDLVKPGWVVREWILDWAAHRGSMLCAAALRNRSGQAGHVPTSLLRSIYELRC
jgi:hypothetical protein